MKIAQDAFESAFGIRPILTRSGGTLPIMPALQDKGIPTILSGFTGPEDNFHAPDESFRLESLRLGEASARSLYAKLATLPRR